MSAKEYRPYVMHIVLPGPPAVFPLPRFSTTTLAVIHPFVSLDVTTTSVDRLRTNPRTPCRSHDLSIEGAELSRGEVVHLL